MRSRSRRRFIQAGLAGSALLAGASFLAPVGAVPSRALDTRVAELVGVLAPVVLLDVFPTETAARDAAIREVREGFGRALSGLDPAVQAEIGQMLSLLVYAPSRIAMTGVWSAWSEASPRDIAAFLQAWRTSRFELKRSGYRALSQLIQAAWYDTPTAWAAIGYPGPPPLPA